MSAVIIWIASTSTTTPARAQGEPATSFQERWDELTKRLQPTQKSAPNPSENSGTEGRAPPVPSPAAPTEPDGHAALPDNAGWPASILPMPQDLATHKDATPTKPADTGATASKPAEEHRSRAHSAHHETPTEPIVAHETRHVTPIAVEPKAAPKMAPHVVAKPPTEPRHEAERPASRPERTARRHEPTTRSHAEPAEDDFPPLPARRETVGLSSRAPTHPVHPSRAASGGLPAALKPTLPPDGSPL